MKPKQLVSFIEKVKELKNSGVINALQAKDLYHQAELKSATLTAIDFDRWVANLMVKDCGPSTLERAQTAYADYMQEFADRQAAKDGKGRSKHAAKLRNFVTFV